MRLLVGVASVCGPVIYGSIGGPLLLRGFVCSEEVYVRQSRQGSGVASGWACRLCVLGAAAAG